MATFLVQEVYKITGIGPVPVGKVEGDVLRVGMSARVQGGTFKITRIEKNHAQLQSANPGDVVGLGLTFTASNAQDVGFFGKLFGGSDQGYATLKNYRAKQIDFS
jgi:elongation factor 1-alpha